MGFTIAVPALWALVESGARRGCDTGAMLEHAGIDAGLAQRTSDIPAADRRLPVTKMHALWGALMREVRDPGFPVEVARSMSADAFDFVRFLDQDE